VLQEFNTSKRREREKKIPNNIDIIRRHGIREEKKKGRGYMTAAIQIKIFFVVGSTLFLIRDFLFNKRDGKATKRRRRKKHNCI
jgi:hypothetical protein